MSEKKRNIKRRNNDDDDSDDSLELKNNKMKKNDDEKIKEYEKRVQNYDKSKTKNFVPGQTDERRQRNQISKYKDNEIVTEELRVKSRHDYLNKRRKDKMVDLEDELIDEKLYFKNDKLTKREKNDYDRKKLLLNVAKLQEDSKLKVNQQYYSMPTDNILLPENVFEEKKKSKKTLNDWEARQLQTGIYKDKNKIKNDEYYEMLKDDYVDFDKDLEITKNEEIKEKEFEKKYIEEKDLTIEEVKKLLPIYKLKDELIQKVRDNQFIIIEGETGSGKTTQIPQYLYEAGFCENDMKIGCTQPRRVAAMSVAARVAQEMCVKLGDKVGYSVRFESRVSDQTLIKYMTDGMLLREFLNDPQMSCYSVLIIDEAHERTLQTDILFGLLLEIIDERPDMKVLISSATCDTKLFSDYFNAPIFNIPGRRYPVETYYTQHQEANYVEAAVVTVLQIHITQSEGDILVFLTGQEDIEDAMDSLNERIKCLGNKIKELIILPIYSSLPSEKQAKIFIPTPPGARKVVLATNIAETSLTIDGIKYVIDSGYCKQKWFDPTSKMDTLKVVPITKAAAVQRAGRAGRVAPGKCFRLYKKCTFDDEFDDQPVPEIQRTNLGNIVLLLKSLGINDVSTFAFMDKPFGKSLLTAVEELYSLGALNKKCELSLTGRKMVEIPCDPMISKMILSSEKYGCSEEIMTIAAMISLDNTVFYTPKEKKLFATQAHRSFMDEDGDQLTLLKIYNEYANNDYSSEWCKENYIQSRTMKVARNIRDQLVNLADRLELKMISKPDDTLSIRKAITAGFFLNTARFNGDCYRRIKSKDSVYMQPNSVFALNEENPRYVVYNNIVATKKEYMRCVMKIDPKWLTEVAPHIYKDSDFDGDRKYKKMPIMTKKKLS